MLLLVLGVPTVLFAVGVLAAIALRFRGIALHRRWPTAINCAGVLLLTSFNLGGLRHTASYDRAVGPWKTTKIKNSRLDFGSDKADAPHIAFGLVEFCESWSFYGKELSFTYGFADETGQIVIPARYGVVGPFVDGVVNAAVDRGDGIHAYGLIDVEGRWVVPPKYDLISRPREGLYLSKKDGRLGFIDKRGSIRIPLVYENVHDFVDGLAAVRSGELWGYLDHSGHFAIEPIYDAARSFSEGLAAVNVGGAVSLRHDSQGHRMLGFQGGNWGYIDSAGEFVIEPRYDAATSFENGIAEVSLDGDRFLIDKQGEIVESDK